MPRSLITIALSLSVAACTASDTASGSLTNNGKADDLGGACEEARLDENQVCRNANGTFAEQRCCDQEFGEDGTYDDSSGIGCIFGDHLVSLARMSDLAVNDEMFITADSELTGVVLQQVLDTHFEEATGLEDVLGQTDEDEIELLRIRDVAHQRNFNMYIWSAGDTIVGRIYYSQSMRIAAEIGDGSIFDCDAGYSNYDDLPFFYTN